MRKGDESLFPKSGGYENTKTWKLADLIYDITVLFCDKYVDQRSRTHDQMVQAARSGAQNLQEGSVDSAVSKKIEIKLTGIAKGSLEELRRDYRKFLSHRQLPEWPRDHPALLRFKKLRCASLKEFRMWVAEETRQNETDEHRPSRTNTSFNVHGRPCESVFPAVCAANGVLSLLNLCIYLIGRQMDAQARDFLENGGFTERLYRQRKNRRDG